MYQCCRACHIFSSLPRRAERPIHRKVTLNQSRQEGLKTDEPFSACPQPSLLSLLTHPHSFTPDNSPYPQRTRHKEKESQDNSRWDAIRHPWLIPLLDLYHPNKTLQSAKEPTGTSIMHWEQAAEHRERESHPSTGARQRGCSACQSQSEGVRGGGGSRLGKMRREMRPGSQAPSTKRRAKDQSPGPEYRQTLPQESSYFASSCWGGCGDSSCPVLLLSLPRRLWNQRLRTQRVRPF